MTSKIALLATLLIAAALPGNASPASRESVDTKVVARVSGRPISAQAVALRAQVVRQVRQIELPAAEQEALTQLVREESLLALAEQEGVVVPVDTVRNEIAQMRSLAETAPDEDTQQVFAKAAEQYGLTAEAFVNDPRVVAAYQRAFTIAEMRQRLARRFDVPLTDDAALDGKIDALTKSSGIRVERNRQQ